MIEEGKPTCHVKLGGYYLREIKDFADLTFGVCFMDAKLNRVESCFEVWITDGADEKARKKFEEKFKQCTLKVFSEKTKPKK